jgi:hemerythrin-like domain-containing protein
MEVLTKLTHEHAQILQGINCLETARAALEKNQHPPVDFFETAILFFTEYADRLHHYKEEYLLFSSLASKKGGSLDLEIGSLRYQHELNRGCIKKIKESLNGYETNTEIAVTTLLKNIAAYISILKRHIYREDQLFFPMAESELSENEKRRLKEQFDEEEAALKAKKINSENLARLCKMKNLISGFKNV